MPGLPKAWTLNYRLVALDIDGTIRTVERSSSERTRRAIANVQETGAVVTLATGRMFSSAVAATAELDITAPIVTFQGAHVANPATGEVLWHRPLTPAMALKALDSLAGGIGRSWRTMAIRCTLISCPPG